MMPEGALAKAKRYLETHSKETLESKEKREVRVAGPCITISRQTGAGSKEVAKVLIDILQAKDKKKNSEWALFDKNLISKVIEDHQLPSYLSKLLEERSHSEIFSLMNEYLAGNPGTWSLVQKTSETILRLADLGNLIIIGRGSNAITSKLNNVLHIRLIASNEDRIRHIMEFYNLKTDDAIDFIEKDDAARRKYLSANFNKNIDDPSIYHLILNTSLMDYKTSAELIAEAVIKKFPQRMGL